MPNKSAYVRLEPNPDRVSFTLRCDACDYVEHDVRDAPAVVRRKHIRTTHHRHRLKDADVLARLFPP